MEFQRPTELADHFGYMILCAPDLYPHEDYLGDNQVTNAIAFRDASRGLEKFIASARTEEGQEKLSECLRNLHVAYEFYEHGDNEQGAEFLQETERMFQRCRKYIPISDE
jgi:hypothetical protein